MSYEIEIPFNKESILEGVEDELYDHLNELEGLLHGLCSDGSVDADSIEVKRKGERFEVSWDELVYSGCRDLDFRNKCNVTLDHKFTDTGVVLFVAEDTVASIRTS